MKKKLVKRGVGGVVVAALLFAIAESARPIHFNLKLWPDQGPYTGTPCEPDPSAEPLQVFPLKDGLQLEVYLAEGQPSNTVLLRKGADQILWCIVATDDSYGRVNDLDFTGYDTSWMGDYVVKGSTGGEASYWYIDRQGALDFFYHGF